MRRPILGLQSICKYLWGHGPGNYICAQDKPALAGKAAGVIHTTWKLAYRRLAGVYFCVVGCSSVPVQR